MITVLNIICVIINIILWICISFEKGKLEEKIKSLETENNELKAKNEKIRSQQKKYAFCSEISEDELIKQALIKQLEDIKTVSSYENHEGLPQLTMALCEVVDRLKDL